ncbi:MAG: MOSC domain-containing protein [Acidobacteriota bacterium]
MKLISVNVGGPRDVDWHGRPVQTSIWKDPVEGRVPLRRLNLEGDQQSDLSVHGGPHKAVYLYPIEHYARWARELPEIEFPLGAFGENFTTEGLLEDDVAIGDRFKVGTAELVVTQPRMPCFKLGIRFGRDDMVKRFLRSGRSGYYVAVVREGVVGRGDAIERLSRDRRGVSIADVFALYGRDAGNRALLERVVDHPGLPESWRELFRQRLRALDPGK